MPDRTVYLLEVGFGVDLPGLAPNTPSLTFPFWGTLMLFDFAYAALRGITREPCWVVAESQDRQAVATATTRWGKGTIRCRDAERGIEELRRLVGADTAPVVVLSSTAYAVFLDSSALAGLSDREPGRRLRVGKSPLPVYLLPRAWLLETLDEVAALEPDQGGSLRGLMQSHLPRRVRDYLEVPGDVHFLDNMMQMWESHHFLRENLGGARVARYIDTLAGLAGPEAVARLSETGYARDSLIASGAVVDGWVTDSVVFPGVVVRRGARVTQSVLMTGSHVGAEAKVTNTLTLPWSQDQGGEGENVGEGAEIGEIRNAMQTRNGDYPRHIAHGMTLLGMNATVPSHVTVGAGCYVGPGVASALRSLKRLDWGASIR